MSIRSGSSAPCGRVDATHTFSALVAMCRCFEYGRYTRKPSTIARCTHTRIHIHTRAPSGDIHVNRWEAAADRGVHEVGDSATPGGDARAVVEQQGRDDPEDQPEDPVGVQPVAADEPLRPLHEPDPDRDREPDQHAAGEHVLHEAEPPRASDPRDREVRVDRLPEGLHDRREQDEEAPEDQRVHHARHRPLEELSLAEDLGGLASHPNGHVAGPVHGAPQPHDPSQEPGPPGEQTPRQGEGEHQHGGPGDHRRRV